MAPPADTSNELDVQNKWEENTHITNTHNTHIPRYFQDAHFIPIVGVGNRGEYYLVHGDLAALVRNYLEVYWPCAGELSAVNAIGYAIA